MEKERIKAFKIIGISVLTTNENKQSAKDIGELWNRFTTENIIQKIPNRLDDTIYAIYTDYESDFTMPYTTILACKVGNIDMLPEGMISKSFEEGTYVKFVSRGNLSQGIVYNTWTEIWNTDLDRTYSADFEICGKKAQDPSNAELEIFIAVKE